MKKLVLVAVAVVVTFGAVAQGTVINKYFDQLGDNEDFVKVSISSKMFSLFTELEAGSEEEEEFLKAVSKLKGMKMVVGDSVPKEAGRLYSQAIKDVDSEGFDELMTVKDAEENFKFSIKEDGGKISELVMIAGGKEKFVIMSLYGEIDLKNISKIARSMKVEGFKHLQEHGN